MSSLAPELFRKILIESLTDKERPAYGQVATVDSRGLPQIRTVHLRYLDDLETIAFGTNTESPKWRQLTKSLFLSGCYFDDHRQIQIRWESPIRLITTASQDEKEKNVVKKMWRLIRLPIRMSYWLDVQKKSVKDLPKLIANEPCPTFGVVICHPQLWDFHEVNLKNLMKSRRHIFRLEKNEWKCQKVSTLHGKEF